MWDDRIDEAARELTKGSPGGDFKARVLERIEHEAGRPSPWPSWKRWLAWAVPLTAACALLVAVGIYRSDRQRIQVKSDTTTAQSLVSSGSAEIQPKLDSSTEIGGEIRLKTDPGFDTARKPDSTSVNAPTLAVAFDATADTNDPEAITLEPLAVAPIVFDAMEIADAVIPELTVSSIDVPALDQ